MHGRGGAHRQIPAGHPALLERFEYANVSIPIAILIWLMIYPMMLKVDSGASETSAKTRRAFRHMGDHWLIKPFTMFGIAWLFFFVFFKALIPTNLAKEYLTARFCWERPLYGDGLRLEPSDEGRRRLHGVQVATNDLIILFAFTPSWHSFSAWAACDPWDTLILSVVLFVVIPLAGGAITRNAVIKKHGAAYFERRFIPKFGNITVAGLLLTLVIIFSFQGDVILHNPLHIVLIAVPLILQTFLIFFIAYLAGKVLKLPHDIAAPAGMIGASNFFELAVAVAISLFGTTSPAALATIVGVLTEVPVMLLLVRIATTHEGWFRHE